MKKLKVKITEKIVDANYEVKMPVKAPGTEIDFVSLTAHQLRKPLSSIRLSLEMLLDGDFGKISEEQKDIIEKILQMNSMLIFLVKDLLDLAKIEDKNYSFNITLVDIQELIEFIISFAKQEIKNKKIKFTFKKPEVKPPKIALDKEKICLVIQNLLDNAIKYTKDGGSIAVSFNIDSQNLEFQIQDSGIGIPEQQKKNLFTKFFRGDNAVKMEVVGSGLGLFIAKDIIEAHYGKIWFESKENNGSCFFFTIPVKGVDPAPIKN